MSGIDQIHETVAAGADVEGPDLARDPQIVGKRLPEGAIDATVELSDGERGALGSL
jgi:hypothetical protein